MNNTTLQSFRTRLQAKHLRNKEKGVYRYMWKTALKITLIYLAVMIPAVLIGKYLIDFSAIFKFLTTRFQDWGVLTIFFFQNHYWE